MDESNLRDNMSMGCVFNNVYPKTLLKLCYKKPKL